MKTRDQRGTLLHQEIPEMRVLTQTVGDAGVAQPGNPCRPDG